MKILHIGKYFLPFSGGIEYFMGSLIEEQLIQGHSVSAIVHHHLEKEKTSIIDYKGADIHLLKTFGTIPYVPLSLGFYKKYNQVVKGFKPDVIHLHLPNVSAFFGLFLPAAGKIPWVIHWHSDVLDNSSPRFIKMLYPFYRIFENSLLRRAKRVIATSPAYARTSIPLSKFTEKVVVIPLGLQPLPHFNVPKPVDTVPNVLKLLCIGRLSYYKGYTHLLKAVSIAVRGGVDLKLEIVGAGEFMDILVAQIEKRGLSGQVQLLGHVPDLVRDEKLNQCDLLCLPSIERTEAFGLVLLEAMSVGKPCLVSDVRGSGMSWVVVNGETGFVYKAGDSNELALKLAEISRNPGKLPGMGKAGYRRFVEMFQIPVIVSRIEQLYRQILDGKAS